LTPSTGLSNFSRVRRRLYTLLVAAATAGAFCAAHLSHAERQACITGSAVFAAPAGGNPAACLGAQRI
jgi:hypothetical protein